MINVLFVLTSLYNDTMLYLVISISIVVCRNFMHLKLVCQKSETAKVKMFINYVVIYMHHGTPKSVSYQFSMFTLLLVFWTYNYKHLNVCCVRALVYTTLDTLHMFLLPHSKFTLIRQYGIQLLSRNDIQYGLLVIICALAWRVCKMRA